MGAEVGVHIAGNIVENESPQDNTTKGIAEAEGGNALLHAPVPIKLDRTDLHIVYIIPFFSAVASTLPYVYLTVALAETFDASSIIIGLVVSGFNVARGAIIVGNVFFPRTSCAVGSAVGLAAFVGLGTIELWMDKSGAMIGFAACNISVGLSFGICAVQIFAKQEHERDMDRLRFALRRQSVMGGMACIFAYFLSGVLYANYGIPGVAYCGILSMVAVILSLVDYLVLSQEKEYQKTLKETPQPQMDTQAANGPSSGRSNSTRSGRISHRKSSVVGSILRNSHAWIDFDNFDGNTTPPDRDKTYHTKEVGVEKGSIRLPFISVAIKEGDESDEDSDDNIAEGMNIIDREFGSTAPIQDLNKNLAVVESRPTLLSATSEKLLKESLQGDSVAQKSLINMFSSSTEVKNNSISFIFAISFLMDGTTSSVIFTVGPLFLLSQFGKDTGVAGVLFAAASIFGTIMTTIMMSETIKPQIQKCLPSPSNIYVLLIIISVATLLLAVPLFHVHVVAIFLIIGGNEVLWASVTEIQGAIATAQFYNVVGPIGQLVHKAMCILTSLVAPLLLDMMHPLPFYVSGSIAGLFTVFFIYKVQQHISDNLVILEQSARGDLGKKSARGMSFATQEIISRMASVVVKSRRRLSSIFYKG